MRLGDYVTNIIFYTTINNTDNYLADLQLVTELNMEHEW